MAYYIRAKSYYRYALDLFKDLPKFKDNPAEFQKRAQEIFKLGMKAVWSLSYITPPEKSPEFKELWEKTVESLDPEDIPEIEKIKDILFSDRSDKEKILEGTKTFLKIIKKILQPIL
ncbi:MAG: hypothetical protein OD816_000439 [Thermodesulfobacterium sp.]|uniref:Uncharacterized protein n=1 Tax=Candidatus Thermodesulfobacterium syntrophicum TaxID=3060442 RepID=A0AAE3P5G0_9BACT|nr:hypothetical protein [Candidatus Thermodesulfobacterium syntrophicum]